MKILGVTMGRNLQVFLNLHERLQARDLTIEAPAVYASSSLNYRRALKDFPYLEGLATLKEWDLTQLRPGAAADKDRLARYQAAWPGSLWHAVLADRRLAFGPLSKARQDYRSRYSEDELYAILDQALVGIDGFIDEVKPDAAISFGTATVGDFIFEVLLKQKGVPFWQLKATKVANNVALLDSGIDLPQNVIARFHRDTSYDAQVRAEAERYLSDVRRRGVKYEGAILFDRKRMLGRLAKAPRRLVGAALSDLRVRRDPVLRQDAHLPPALRSAWLTEVVHPLRTFQLGRSLPLVPLDDLAGLGDFAFYPMHFEPEVSLQIFGRPFQNQIELIRNIAFNLPLGMRLLVKEHPRALGFRGAGYYRKLLDIPNVRLSDPFIPTIEIVRRARLACVVSGSVGLEAVILGKPLMVFGRTLYGLLPRGMVREIENLNDLDRQIAAALSDYAFDEEAILRYLSAQISQAVPVDLYTKLLRKQGRYSIGGKGSSEAESYERLADLVLSKLGDRSDVRRGQGR